MRDRGGLTMRLAWAALAGALAAAVGGALWRAGALERLEHLAWDAKASFLAEPAPDDLPIRLILRDQQSLNWVDEELGHGPLAWPRSLYAAITEYCREAGAAAIIFDMDFQHASPFGVEDDLALAEQITRTPAFTLALRLTEGQGRERSWPGWAAEPPWTLDGLDAWEAGGGPGFAVGTADFSHPDVLGDSPAALGHVRSVEESDGVNRRVRVFHRFDDRLVPQLPLAGYAAAARAHGDDDSMRIEPGRFHIGPRVVPIDSAGRAILRYRRPTEGLAYPAYSAAAILHSYRQWRAGDEPLVGPEELAGRYILFGDSAETLFDNWPTPVKPLAPGVEVHATVLDNLLNGSFLRPVGPGPASGLALLLALGGAMLTVASTRWWWSVACGVVLLPIPAAVAASGYGLGWAWPVAGPTAIAALALAGAVTVNYATVGRQKAYIRRAFAYYLSPAVIGRILDDPRRLRLGGERRELTILFSDLRGFSTIAERLDSQTLSELLNEYLTDMTDIILDEEGTVDKYEGDAVIAFWNAPVDQPDHAERATRAAVRCQRRLDGRRPDFHDRFGVELHMRIGVHTGTVNVGNFGSRTRFDYTVIGDAANLAARLEGANKHLGTRTLVSESTWERANRKLRGIEIGRIRVVGRGALVRVFEPIGFVDEPLDEPTLVLLRARRLCEEGDWTAAQRELTALGAGDGHALAHLYLDRTKELERAGAERWDDTWNLAEK